MEAKRASKPERVPFTRGRGSRRKGSTIEERLKRRKQKIYARKQNNTSSNEEYSSSLLERIVEARTLLKKEDPKRYRKIRQNIMAASPSIPEDNIPSDSLAEVQITDETKCANRPARKTSVACRSSDASTRLIASGRSSSTPEKEEMSIDQCNLDTQSGSSISSINSCDLPPDDFNRMVSAKRKAAVKSMVKNTLRLTESKCEKLTKDHEEEKARKEERARRNLDLIKTQAIRGRNVDDFTRVKCCLPYFSEQSSQCDTEAMMVALRLALRQPNARNKLSKTLDSYQQSQESNESKEATKPSAPSEIKSSAPSETKSSAPSDTKSSAPTETKSPVPSETSSAAAFIKEIDGIVDDIVNGPFFPSEPGYNAKFPVPDVFSVRPLPDDLTGNLRSADLDSTPETKRDEYVKALEHIVDNDLTDILKHGKKGKGKYEGKSNKTVKKNSTGHKNKQSLGR